MSQHLAYDYHDYRATSFETIRIFSVVLTAFAEPTRARPPAVHLYAFEMQY